MRWGDRWSGFWGGPGASEQRCVDARDRLPRKIRGGTYARDLACIFGTRYGDQAAAALDVRHAIRNIAEAEGDLLDLIGRVMTLPRAGDDDARYRRALSTWALCRGSECTTNEILAIVRSWVGAGPTISIDPVYPMGFRVELDDLPTGDLARLVQFVSAAKGAAYGASIVVTSDTSGLLCDTVAEDVTDAFLCDTVAVDVVGAGTLATIFAA